MKNSLHRNGVELLEYIPENTFLSAVNLKITGKTLAGFGVQAVGELKSEYKIDPNLLVALLNNPFNPVKVNVTLFPNLKEELITWSMNRHGLTTRMKGHKNTFIAELTGISINALITSPEISYVDFAAGSDTMLMDGSKVLLGSNGLTNSTPGIGRNLSGEGVVIGLGDDGDIGHHRDFYGKLANIETFFPSNHATHVAGIMAGTGLMNPAFRGHAYKSKIAIQLASGIIVNTTDYYNRYGMVLTNNSYGAGGSDCQRYGNYSAISHYLDSQLLENPEVMHVFAVGNDGWKTCPPLQPGYRTIFADFQVAKNILTVSGTGRDPDYHFYSQGPTKDGRLKPEITSIGFEVTSAIFHKTVPYSFNYGSSMAAPQVTGIMALLIERYRQLHSNANPKAGLMKAIVCNTAMDIGKRGPDYEFGFGWINAEDAVQAIEKNEYYSATVAHQSDHRTTITVPAGTKRLKVLLYWPDVPSSLYSFKNLVNDLDLKLYDPAGNVIRPLILDTTIAGMILPAHPGDDHINNIEQIVIENPLPGNYSVSVRGYKIPSGEQDFFVTYQTENDQLQLRHPIGGETLFSNTFQYVTWKEAGVAANNYTADLSLDGGANWQFLGTANGPYQLFRPRLPAVVSTNAILRLTNNVNGNQTQSQPFRIIPDVPFTVTTPCPGVVQVRWTKPAGVDSITVMKLVGTNWITENRTTDTTLIIEGLKTDSLYWFTVFANVNGYQGNRSGAKNVFPVGGICFLPKYNADIKLNPILAPLSGRKGTSTERGSSERVVYSVRNNDDAPTSIPFYIKTYVNGVLRLTDTVSTAIPANSARTILSSGSIDLSVTGRYVLRSVVEKTDDPDTTNNISTSDIRIVENAPVALPSEENFDLSNDTTYTFPGYPILQGADKWDYLTASPVGKLLIVNNGSDKHIGFDRIADPYTLAGSNSLIGTFNLSNYNTGNSIRLKAKHNGSRAISVAARGSDTAKWISLGTLLGSTRYIDLIKPLRDSGQQLTSSFQVRFNLINRFTYTEEPNGLDSVVLFLINKDVGIEAATILNDGFYMFEKDSLKYRIKLRNTTGTTATNVNAVLRTVNGRLYQELIPSINPFDSAIVNMSIPAAETSGGENQIRFWIEYAGDEYSLNDSATLAILEVLNLVDTFPYLQSFEVAPKSWKGEGFFELSDQPSNHTGPGKAANGKIFWHVKNELDNFLEGTITTPGFNLVGLQNPAVSFSFIENIRKYIDSAWFQVSYNGGKTWKRVMPLDSINWHNHRNDSVWSNDHKKYWHVATAKLPRIDSIAIFRFVFSRWGDYFSYPKWPGGIAIDDFHVYDLKTPVEDSSVNELSGQVSVNGDRWIDIITGGKVIASMNTYGQDAGIVKWKRFNNVSNEFIEGQQLLNRKWLFTFSNPLLRPASLRLYITDAEAENLLQSNRCLNSEWQSAYDFSVFHYSGPAGTNNAILSDNLSAFYRYLPASDFELAPFDKGYYAEVETKDGGEFYLGSPGVDSLRYDITLTKQHQQINISWPISADTSILQYELEMATGTSVSQSGNFTRIASIAAGMNNSFNLPDTAEMISWYRLKTIYKSGCFSYSRVKSIQNSGSFTFRLFPNPSRDGLFYLIPSAAIPGDVFLEVSNALGQVIWQKKTNASGIYDRIKIDLTRPGLSNGSYLLRIRWNKGESTLKLLKR